MCSDIFKILPIGQFAQQQLGLCHKKMKKNGAAVASRVLMQVAAGLSSCKPACNPISLQKWAWSFVDSIIYSHLMRCRELLFNHFICYSLTISFLFLFHARLRGQCVYMFEPAEK